VWLHIELIRNLVHKVKSSLVLYMQLCETTWRLDKIKLNLLLSQILKQPAWFTEKLQNFELLFLFWLDFSFYFYLALCEQVV
jgi:hypothetical protein